MLTGLFSFIGIIIGASLQYVFTRHIEGQRHSRDIRSKAYMDYLNCVGELAQFRPATGSHERKTLDARTADAKSRICLYGSTKVVSAFSKFQELGASTSTTEQCDAFINMVSKMREDSGSKTCENNKEISTVLLGIRN